MHMEKEKYCVIACFGDWSGPAVYECDATGKVGRRVLKDEVAKLMKEKISFDRFGVKINELAGSNGYEIYYSDYSSEKNESLDESEDDIRNLKQAMLQGVVHFRYRKAGKPEKVNKRTGAVTPAVPGEERDAHGTLQEEIIRHTVEQVEKAAENRRVPNDAVMVYFDTDKNDWRCFRKENFLGIVQD